MTIQRTAVTQTTIRDTQLGSHCSGTCLLSSMLFCNRLSVDLSKFEANIEEREKEVKHSMSTLFLLLTQVLMSQVIGSCPGEGH